MTCDKTTGEGAHWRARLKLPALMSALLWLSGCDYQEEGKDLSVYETQDAEQVRQRALRAAVQPISDEEILDIVRQKDAPDGQGNTVAWTERQLNDPAVHILFPTWSVERRGANRYEVRYTYTSIDRQNHLSRRGYAWQVDGMMKQVGEPVALLLEESGHRARTFSQQRSARIEEEEAGLE